jgi:hypothetical protein
MKQLMHEITFIFSIIILIEQCRNILRIYNLKTNTTTTPTTQTQLTTPIYHTGPIASPNLIGKQTIDSFRKTNQKGPGLNYKISPISHQLNIAALHKIPI